MHPAAGTGFMIMYRYLGAFRAFVIVMEYIWVRHTGGMPGWDFRHESIFLALWYDLGRAPACPERAVREVGNALVLV
jgi:hypothetical protein